MAISMMEIQNGLQIILTEHREKFLILFKSGVFNLVSGQIIIHVNNNQFQTVSITTMEYKRKSKNNDIIPI